MEATVWITGNVGSDVEFRTFGDQIPSASLRVASTPRLRRGGEWVDGNTTWLTVTCTRALAENVRDSISRGDAVVVVGKLRTSRWEDPHRGPQERLSIDAISIGHDLSRGVAQFRRHPRKIAGEPAPVAELIHPTDSEARDGAAASEQEPPAA